jgi:hypothetical protein
MTPKSSLVAAGILAAALAAPVSLAQAAAIAPVQPAAGKTAVTPVQYRQGTRGYAYRHPYRYHRRYGYNWYLTHPNVLGGAYAYQPAEGTYQGYGYQQEGSPCPYYGSNDLWWCH